MLSPPAFLFDSTSRPEFGPVAQLRQLRRAGRPEAWA